MSNNNDVLQGENFSHTVSAQYDSQSSADQAVQRLIHKANLHRIKLMLCSHTTPTWDTK